jgi:hypothetical protein
VPYRVLIDDSFRYQVEAERVLHGQFETAAEAVTACREIIDDFLTDAYQPGMTAAVLWEQYTQFGYSSGVGRLVEL